MEFSHTAPVHQMKGRLFKVTNSKTEFALQRLSLQSAARTSYGFSYSWDAPAKTVVPLHIAAHSKCGRNGFYIRGFKRVICSLFLKTSMFVTFPRTQRSLFLRSLFLGAGALSMLVPVPAHAQSPVPAATAVANKAELAQRVHEYQGNDIWPSKLVAGMDFKLSAAAWKIMLSSDGVEYTSRFSRDLGNYIKAQKLGDLDRVETANNNDRQSTQPEVDELLAQAKKKVSFAVEATQPSFSPTKTKMFLTYLTYVGQFIGRGNWSPRGGRANIKLVMSSTAKDIAVVTSKDATNFTIIAPLQEPADWGTKIDRGLKRGGSALVPDGSLRRQIVAARGHWDERAAAMVFERGWIVELPAFSARTQDVKLQNIKLQTRFFKRLEVREFPPSEQWSGVPTLRDMIATGQFQALSLPELQMERVTTRRQDRSVVPRSAAQVATLTFAIHDRLAAPLVCVALVLIGCPLGVRAPRAPGISPLGRALMVLLVYFAVWLSASYFGKSGTSFPLLWAYLPLLLLIGAGLALLHRKAL